ncbi:MAG: PHP domain-containing protein, partial [Tetragenococcus koreensis]
MSVSQLTTLTSYSLLQSTITIPQYVQAAKKLGYDHLGITDRNNLYGALDFVKACQKVQIQPIIGLLLEYYSQQTQKEHEIFLFAKNDQGYKKLMRISSQKMSGSQVLLEKEASLTDLFAILPAENELSELRDAEDQQVNDRVAGLQKVFGKEQLFYGVPYQEPLVSDVTEWMEQQEVAPAAYQLVDSLHSAEAFSVKVMHHIKEGEQIENLQQEMQQVTPFRSLETPEKRETWYETNAPQAL